MMTFLFTITVAIIWVTGIVIPLFQEKPLFYWMRKDRRKVENQITDLTENIDIEERKHRVSELNSYLRSIETSDKDKNQ